MRQYIPSNGTEGYSFIEQWCCRCERDKPSSQGVPFDECSDDDLCPILAASFRGEAKEWVYGQYGPMCMNFVRFVDPLVKLRCNGTLEMF